MNFLYKAYYALPDFSKIGGIAGKAINRGIAISLKRIFDATVPKHFMRTAGKAGYGLNTTEERDCKYIVSLTSFPARIEHVWITIETILRQSFKPDMIILWLSKDQFPDEKVPESINRLKERGLTVEFREGDMRSHKKYMYALKEYPNDYIITLDDDLYYEKDHIKNVVELKNKFPDAVATNRAHKITFDKNQTVNLYRLWKHNATDKNPSHLLVQTGGYGTIYKKNDLHEDFNNPELIKEIAFHADDLWLKVMVFLKGKKIVTNTVYNKDPITVKNSQIEKLVTKNVIEGGNDIQLAALMNYYNITPQDFKD